MNFPTIPDLGKCDLYDICDEIDNLYNMCAGCSAMTQRCTPAEKVQIKLLYTISKKLDSLDSKN